MAETVERFVRVAIAEGRDERADRLRTAATVLRDRASAMMRHDAAFDQALKAALAETNA
jgi:hypothetical protein